MLVGYAVEALTPVYAVGGALGAGLMFSLIMGNFLDFPCVRIPLKPV